MTASRTTSRFPRLPVFASVALGTGLVLVTGCTSAGTEDPEPAPAAPAGGFRLVAYDSCADAERELRDAASDYMGPWGFGTLGGDLAVTDGEQFAEEGDGAAAPGAAAAPAGPEAARGAGATGTDPGFSGTNVHEQGVDEPDLVKTDGRRIVTVSSGVLRVVDAARRVETGTLDLRATIQDSTGSDLTDGELLEFAYQPADLLLHGDRALVLMPYGWHGGLPRPALPVEPGAGTDPDQGSTPEGSPLPSPISGPLLLLVDLAGDPRLVSKYTVDGALVDSRAVGATARVVVRSQPRLDLPALAGDATDDERLAANRDAVEAAELERWLPRYEVTTGGESQTGQVDCTALSRPAGYAENGTGTSLLTVLTFELSAPALGDGQPVSVAADGDTVYSNGPSLYVTSDQRWQVQPGRPESPRAVEARTEIYKFDTSGSGAPRYTAAGAVDGWLLNQYAMSEWEGQLRVATTQAPMFWGPAEEAEEPTSESTVYVLSEQDGTLAETGSVSGLGKGERIYSVRFTGPVGYVVTFRETDPLYTLDLRDPAAPAVLGELKITGYSAYLHPLGDGRLVGVGQEADEQGRPLGTQVSLFDVTDLANPVRLAQHHVSQGYSEAEFDPHAFLWWPDQDLLVIPLYAPEGSGALALRVGEDELTERELISHPRDTAGGNDIRRSLVIGDTLWTLSYAGLQANSISTLDTTAWLPF